jgi:O-antigen/teichoic acid export membrane protein
MEAKSLRKNYIYNALFYIFNLIFPLITIPFVAKALGPQQLGIYLYSYSVVALFALVSNLGIMNYGNKIIAANRDDKKKLAKTFSSLYLISLCMTIPALLLYLGYCLIFVQENKNIFLLQSIFLLSTLFDISWFYMGMEEFKVTIKRDVIVKSITLAAILLLVRNQNGLTFYTLIMSLGALSSQLILWAYVRRYIKIVGTSIKESLVHIKPLIVLFIPVLATSVYTTLSVVLLGALSNTYEVGQFVTATRIIAVPLGLITAMGAVMLPRMSNIVANMDSKKVRDYIQRSMGFVMFFSLPICFGLLAISRTLLPLVLGKDFTQSATVLMIISPVIVFVAWANVLRTQFLIPTGRNKIYISSALTAAVVSLALNLLLIPHYKSTGAAIAMFCAELSVMLYQTYSLRNDLKIRVFFRSTLNFLIKALVMFVVILLIGLLIKHVYLAIALQVIIGGLVYCGLNLEYIDGTILNSKFTHPTWVKLLLAKKRLNAGDDNVVGDIY